MTPSNITPMNTESITPEVIAHEIMEAAGSLDSIYCIGITKSGEVWTFLSGTVYGAAYAGVVLQQKAMERSKAT